MSSYILINKGGGITMEVTVNKSVEANIQDVAYWFLLKQSMTHKKLQKLCYYAEAWSETLLDAPICNDNNFEAWVHGPVNRTLYHELKQYGWNSVSLINPNKQRETLDKKFTDDQIELLESVWNTYGRYSADQLEAQTHREKPWVEQRKGIGKFEICNNVISVDTMKEYYGALADDQA
jgi:uncharacterized phage-associated protein